MQYVHLYMYYSIAFSKLIWWLVLYGLSLHVSSIMFFYSAWDGTTLVLYVHVHVQYFLGLCPRKYMYIQPLCGTNPIHCKNSNTLLVHMHVHVYVIVVSWFLQCMGYVLREGCTIPCTVKTMRQLTCTDRPYKANRQISFSAIMSIIYIVHPAH